MTQTAKTYGRALYDLAKDEQLTDEILSQMQALSEAFAQTPDYIKLLATFSISKQERCEILQKDFGGKIQPYLLNFMKLLTERGLIRAFDGCYREFRSQYNADNGIVEATAITAVALSDDLKQKLTAKLEAITDKKIYLFNRIDATVLGGIRLEMDGMQFDGTVRHRLDDIRTILKNTVL